LKVHRSPLAAIAALANGFNSNGSCRELLGAAESYRLRGVPDHWFADSYSWKVASRFVRLPLLHATDGYAFNRTCTLGRRDRIRLALSYWVGWNELSDQFA
jgi:hypothetical protein